MIYHLCGQQAWEQAQKSGMYRTESLTAEGFIHASSQAQVAGSANRYYSGRLDLLLLEVDPARLTAPLKYEPATNGESYPHLYGPLNLDAVVRVLSYLPDEHGTFSSPVFP